VIGNRDIDDECNGLAKPPLALSRSEMLSLCVGDNEIVEAMSPTIDPSPQSNVTISA
jgi:hypothetical protein